MLSYLQARGRKTKEMLRLAYEKFYVVTIPASVTVRNTLKINAGDFATYCLELYGRSSDFIHILSEIYKKSRSIEELRKIMLSVPQQSEKETACIQVISSFPKPAEGAYRSGPLDFKTYYDETDNWCSLYHFLLTTLTAVFEEICTFTRSVLKNPS